MDSRLFTTGIPADNSDAAGHGKLIQPGLAAAGRHRGHGHEQEPGGPAPAAAAPDQAVGAR